MPLSPVVFLSLGPGHPDLLTVRALTLLREADMVMVPCTQHAVGTTTSRAADIIAPWCPSEKLKFHSLPMQEDRSHVQAIYDHLCRDIIETYQQGRHVVVAVEGDSSIYASIHYVQDRLQDSGIPVVQEAGIPSFIAAASLAGLSLVSQQQRLLVIPGSTTASELYHLVSHGHTVVVMKLSQCQDELKDLLRTHPELSCHYFEDVGTSEQFHTTDHSIIQTRHIPYFSLAILPAR